MSRKRTKQYLMLLMVIGLVSIAAGGGGTFASFSAETANNGNEFATGSLILNNNGGHNTCTSAVDSTNHNSSGTGCDTLFNIDHFNTVKASVDTGGAASGQADVPYTGATGNLYPGDSITLSGTGGSETKTIDSIAAGVITLTTNLAHTYASGDSIIDETPTSIAHLTLTNAGTIDASGITFEGTGGSCTASYSEGETTLTNSVSNVGDPSGTSLAVASSTGFPSGSPVVVSDGSGHAQTFISTGAIDATDIGIDNQNWNHTFSSGAHVTGPEFNGYGTAHDLCGDLSFSVIEENSSSFNDDLSTAARCAFGDTTDTLAGANACAFAGASVTTLSGLPSTFQALNLASGANNNTNGQLDAGESRYFLIAVHYKGSVLDNTYQNTKTTSFGLTWHIDQV